MSTFLHWAQHPDAMDDSGGNALCPILRMSCKGCECMAWRTVACNDHSESVLGYCGLAGPLVPGSDIPVARKGEAP